MPHTTVMLAEYLSDSEGHWLEPENHSMQGASEFAYSPCNAALKTIGGYVYHALNYITPP